MNVPLEISFHGIDHSDAVEDLVRQRAAKLEEIADNLNSCRVVLEQPNAHPNTGSNWRVRVDLTVAGGHEIVADRRPEDGQVHDDLYKTVNEAFDVARRNLQKLNAKQRGETKRHPEQMLVGVVSKLIDDYGFIETADGGEIYFHQNAVLNGGGDLEVGVGVAYTEEAGEEGPQASTVRIVDGRHGRRTG